MRTNYVTLGWINCLTGSYSAPDPLDYGWKIYTVGKYEYRLRQILKPGRRCIIVRGRN